MANDILTQAQLKLRLSYDEVAGVFRQAVNSGRAKSGDIAGYTHHTGYVQISIMRKRYMAHRLAWLYVYGEMPASYIDHVNLIKSDNRIENLREATLSENQKNVGMQSNNTSGIKGVRFRIDREKWVATAACKGKNKHLGYFATSKLASDAYQAYAKANHGVFYRNTSVNP
jgi:HNH endonuclease/AP2 domain